MVEKWIHHKGEFSVVCARRADGAVHTFPIAENIHRNHILHASILPARVPQSVEKDAAKIAQALANALELVGLLAVEFFLDEDGTLIVNEMLRVLITPDTTASRRARLRSLSNIYAQSAESPLAPPSYSAPPL